MKAPGAVGDEDGWGITKVSEIMTAGITQTPVPGVNTGAIDGGAGDITWVQGLSDGMEIVGMYYGVDDVNVTLAGSSETANSIGLKAYFVLQPNGSAQAATRAFLTALGGDVNAATALFGDAGSKGRLANNKYVGVGVDQNGNAIGGAIVIATAVAVPGFIGDQAYNAVADLTGIGNGSAAFYADMSALDLPTQLGGVGTVGTFNSMMDTNFYTSVSAPLGTTADVEFHITTTFQISTPAPGHVYNDFNVIGKNGELAGDAVPEPVTMVGLLMSVVGVGGYVRRRRLVVG